ncbi:glycosyl-transferase for dystroglycan-domain-containing protein [Dunaliella salina]|uniref:Glycosyl-transferase for dystroglycan-domain-containing protein n=1 Tax=Dunaliella salina TaxID=3046 RepID=A0ABQ7FUI3_DUNSA|nr:glycosyl-transferase for dystroglycan-domain-containing protein [Dunaliella salina]|eukprot:KAF5826066.1 glycosyl-transferase for dystroglycan-domain-containing protein [Dunaliella salina]
MIRKNSFPLSLPHIVDQCRCSNKSCMHKISHKMHPFHFYILVAHVLAAVGQFECLNSGNFSRTTWNGYVHESERSNVSFDTCFQSRKPQRNNLTIVTQLSSDRLEALKRQCKHYLGPIAAAILVPLVQPDREGTSELSARKLSLLNSERSTVGSIFSRFEELQFCQLSILLCYEVYDSRRASILYPVNALRNYARFLVRTSLLMYLDVDFLPSQSLSERALDSSFNSMMTAGTCHHIAYIVPAFQPSTNELTKVSTTCTKQFLKELFEAGKIKQFKNESYPVGHGSTLFNHWFTTDSVYSISWTHGFEPYVITHLDHVPWLNSGFRGFGRNKVSMLLEMHYRGFQFKVRCALFILHALSGIIMHEGGTKTNLALTVFGWVGISDVKVSSKGLGPKVSLNKQESIETNSSHWRRE